MVFTLSQLLAHLDLPIPPGAVTAFPVEIRGVNTLELASGTDICFAESRDQVVAVASSRAAAVLVPADFPSVEGPPTIRCTQPRLDFFRLAELFVPSGEERGIHGSAVVHPDAILGADISVGPCAVISSGVRVGDRTTVGPGCYLGTGVTLGADCVIEANATVHRETTLGSRCIVHSGTVIGGDGFGYRWDGTAHRKVPQLGRVEIEDDVEIGYNCCVDRATLGVTRVRRGTKIDNLVQVAHNTDIGRHVILVSQAGVAGSSKVGDGAVIAGQVAISDHVKVGAGARVGGQSGVTKDVPDGATVFGTPARPIKDTLKELAALAQLPRLLKQLKVQRAELDELRQQLAAALQHRRDESVLEWPKGPLERS